MERESERGPKESGGVGIEKWEGEGGRCGEFGTKDVAYIVNRELYSVPRLDWVMACILVIAHMIEFTHSPCFCFASQFTSPTINNTADGRGAARKKNSENFGYRY